MNIIFETTDGHEYGRATYTKHQFLRPPQLAFRGQWHLQNRQDGETWVYRAIDGVPGLIGTDPGLREPEPEPVPEPRPEPNPDRIDVTRIDPVPE